MNFNNQSRSSSDIGHFRKVIGQRPNYHLLPGYVVTKILFDKEKIKPTAVQVGYAKTIKIEM